MQDFTTLFAQATAAHEAGQWQHAERAYRSILAVEPAHADALHQLGLLAYQNERFDAAIDLISRALSLSPHQAFYCNTLGGALLAAGRVKEAVASFARAVALAPASLELKNNLANALHADGALAEALALYRDLIARAPSDPDVNNNFGRALLAAGCLDEALDCFRAALAVRPDDALILSHLGNALCVKGAFDEAVTVCRKAVDLVPNSAVLLTNLGNALLGQKCIEDAVAAYETAAKADDRIAEIHKNLGIAYHMAGRPEDAAASFARVLQFDPDDRARVALGHIYVSLGALHEAVDLFRQSLNTAPDDREVRLALGLALNDLGRHADGLAEIARGPGVAHLSLTAEQGEPPAANRRAPVAGVAPNFIGSWFLKDRTLCEALIAHFEANAARHRQGTTSRGTNLSIKRATDLVIFPNDLSTPGFEPLAAYLLELQSCLRDYALQWPHLADIIPKADLVPFQIQRYRPGEHFQAPHSERMSFGLSHRVLAWMTYLNDVEAGGHTRFHNYGIEITPERGRTLIWPAEWTHMHAGEVVRRGTKYVITGWMHFPHPTA